MPTPTPGTATFHTNIDIPAGADAPTRESIADPLEQLTDRTAALGEFFNFVDDEFKYPATKTRTKFIGVSRALLGQKDADGSPEWKMIGTGSPLFVIPIAGADRARMWVPMTLPDGAVITAYSAFVEKGADNASAADQFGALLAARGGFLLFPGSASSGLALGTTLQRAGSGTGRAVAGESGLSITVQGMADYYVYVEGPATEHVNDRVWGVSVTYQDPGPR